MSALGDAAVERRERGNLMQLRKTYVDFSLSHSKIKTSEAADWLPRLSFILIVAIKSVAHCAQQLVVVTCALHAVFDKFHSFDGVAV